jgi:hypothetical protein
MFMRSGSGSGSMCRTNFRFEIVVGLDDFSIWYFICFLIDTLHEFDSSIITFFFFNLILWDTM